MDSMFNKLFFFFFNSFSTSAGLLCRRLCVVRLDRENTVRRPEQVRMNEGGGYESVL